MDQIKNDGEQLQATPPEHSHAKFFAWIISLTVITVAVAVVAVYFFLAQQRSVEEIVKLEQGNSASGQQNALESDLSPGELIIQKNRTVEKTLTAETGETYIETRSPAWGGDLTELWRVSGEKASVLQTYQNNAPGSLTWELVGSDPVVTTTVGPGEAYVDYERTVYNDSGAQIFTLSWREPSGKSLVFTETGKQQAFITPVLDKECDTFNLDTSSETVNIPTVTLTGIKMYNTVTPLPKPLSVSCVPWYAGAGGGLVDPSFTQATYAGKTVQFDVASSYTAVIDLATKKLSIQEK